MSKRRLSPAPLPPSKRLQSISKLEGHVVSKPRITISTLFDELILCVFSHLSWMDLCVAQATNKTWCRLATDNQLWKTLYLKEYGRSRLRGARGFIGRTDGRVVKPLPGRAKAEHVRDWKYMFRISSNWRTGRCVIEPFNEVVNESTKNSFATLPQELDFTHILLSGNLTVTASSRPTTSPVIHLRSLNRSVHSLLCVPTRNSELVHITALALDQSPPEAGHCLRLSAFFSSGRISIFSINHSTPSRSFQTLTYLPVVRNSRTAPIIQAVYHHPLLITLSQGFHLSIYDVSSDTISHTQTLTSFTSFPPTSLVLSTPSSSTYKLILAYAIPVYPAHWSVGATELIISGPDSRASSPSSASALSPDRGNSMSVITTRTTRSFDVPNGWIDERKLRSMREQWGRKVFRVSDTQTDGKWVVLAPAHAFSPLSAPPSPPSSSSSSSTSSSHDTSTPISSDLHSPNILQLYRLSLPSLSHSSPSSSAAAPKLVFVRNLLGPVGPISALALADGRCVSLGVNGGIWVWDLESGAGVEVVTRASNAKTIGVGLGHGMWKGSLAFDDKIIVCAGPNGLEIFRFDI